MFIIIFCSYIYRVIKTYLDDTKEWRHLRLSVHNCAYYDFAYKVRCSSRCHAFVNVDGKNEADNIRIKNQRPDKAEPRKEI